MLPEVFTSKLERKLLEILLLCFFLIGCYRSYDPLTEYIFGTISFGDHNLYAVTSLTHECCGKGRDQLVYNLEYIKYHELQNLMYQEIRPTDKTVLVFGSQASFFDFYNLFVGAIDLKSFHRALPSGKMTPAHCVTVDQLQSDPKLRPEKLYYIELPNFTSDEDLKYLSEIYSDSSKKEFSKDRYKLTLYTFEHLRRTSVKY